MVSGARDQPDRHPRRRADLAEQHLVYTHGYGAVAAQVNTATTEGAPLLTLRDIPPVGRAQIYRAEDLLR